MRLILLALLLSGCTTVGFHDAALRAQHDFGPPATVSVCVLADEGIDEAEARWLMKAAWEEEGNLYGLSLVVPWVRPWPRPAFTSDGILEALEQENIPPECDRLMALVGRHGGDVLWGFVLMPEILGAVNRLGGDRGYAVVRRVTLNQVWPAPHRIIRHEVLHMLGCPHAPTMAECYAAIERFKREAGNGR